MATIVVPIQYNKIQEAINVAAEGDIIVIKPGTYYENMIIKKDNISITTNDDVVIIDGKDVGGIGLNIQGNHVNIEGMEIKNFDIGVKSRGNYNNIQEVYARFNNKKGFYISGNHNKIMSCVSEQNKNEGIKINGDYNELAINRFSYNNIGILALRGHLYGNIIYSNTITNNKEYGIRISTMEAQINVISLNSIGNSKYGIVCEYGRAAFLYNRILNCEYCGISYRGDRGIILDNDLLNNSNGMELITTKSLIAGNAVQEGKNNGITLLKDQSYIASNNISGYRCSGILLLGYNNFISRNDLFYNCMDIRFGIEDNFFEYDYYYEYDLCVLINQLCLPEDGGINFLQLLEIFNRPLLSFLNRDCEISTGEVENIIHNGESSSTILDGADINKEKSMIMDIKLNDNSALMIKGVIADPNGVPLKHAAIEIVAVDDNMFEIASLGVVFTGENGEFTFAASSQIDYNYMIRFCSNMYSINQNEVNVIV